ncbi:hypothetical protein FHT76_006488 [Rhizobium sp. BK176]|nr:hypothetical protein [Rhizobium sp. BK181]MCS3744374.1 hypothetical protein [Rhizobium sp. BK661]MCS4094779.1 hypothetical protein [Rhizobium sp. BK176]
MGQLLAIPKAQSKNVNTRKYNRKATLLVRRISKGNWTQINGPK